MVQGYTTDSGFDAPIGVTFEFKHELQGLSGGITALHNALVGITAAITQQIDALVEDTRATQDLRDEIDITNTNLTTMVNAYVDGTAPATIPVSVAAPTSVLTYQFTATDEVSLAHGAGTANATAFNSGIKIRLHPDASQGVYIGGTGVTPTTGYLLSPGDDIFIEQQFTDSVGIVTTAGGSNMIVYVIGY